MTREVYREQLKELVDSVRLERNSVFIRGQEINLASRSAGIVESHKNQTATQLQQLIYNHFYCQPSTDQSQASDSQAISIGQFLNRLSQSNYVTDGWDRGWTIKHVSREATFVLVKNGAERLSQLGEFVAADRVQLPLRPGSVVNIFEHKESMNSAEYFYYVMGARMPPTEAGNQVRFYWSINYEGMSRLMSHLTARLNKFEIPFNLKCPSHPTYFSRRDASVLYLSAEHVTLACELISGFYEDIVSYLRPEAPLFTRVLAPGISFAESPRDGESFGMSRARVCAEGLMRAHEKQLRQPYQKLSELIETFTRYGYQLEALYRNPASHYPYNFGPIEN
jgi:hypothetical protein